MISALVLSFQTYRPEISHVEVINAPASLAPNFESRKQFAVGIDNSSDHSIEVVKMEVLLAPELFELVTK
jgi:hypothetical protein